MKRFFLFLSVLPALGFVSLCGIALYRLGVKSGNYRRVLPIKEYDSQLDPVFNSGSVSGRKLEGSQILLSRADALVNGELLMFSHWVYRFQGYPDWHLDPINQLICRQDLHWTQTKIPEGSDIKCYWEMSRFEWAPMLARAWSATGDHRYFETLNNLTNNWLEHNPLNQGVNWKCGQETSIRLINILLAWWLLGKGSKERLASIVVDHLTRVSKTLGYAIAQDNNHGTSEAAGLFIGGGWLVRHGEFEEQRMFGRRCVERGRYWLEDRVNTLIFEDGGFSQYSTNYHRVLLDTIGQIEFWRSELSISEFSDRFYTRTKAAMNWLLSIMNLETGTVSNAGANDGARLFCLSESRYDDYRPGLQVLSVLVDNRRLFDSPEADEALAWLGLDATLPKIDTQQESLVHPDFGDVVLRKNGFMALVRFATFRFRPSHADCLHLDLFNSEDYLLRDGGSFSYHEPEQHHYYSGTSSHNTIQFDDHDQMPRVGQFLFTNWLKMDVISGVFIEDGYDCWHGAYTDSWGNQHARTVKVCDSEVLIEDKISGGYERAKLRWRLMPVEWRLDSASVISGDVSIQVVATQEPEKYEIVKGWESTCYQFEEAIPVFEIELPPGDNIITTRVSLN